mgnify:CR=1 FL=1
MKAPSERYLKFIMSDQNLLLLSNKELNEFQGIFDYFNTFVVNDITQTTLKHIDSTLMQDHTDIVVINCYVNNVLIIDIIKKIKEFDEKITVIIILPTQNIQEYIETINYSDIVLTDNFLRKDLSKKLIKNLHDNYSVKAILKNNDENDEKIGVDVYLDTFEGEVLFLIEELRHFVKDLDNGNLSKELFSEISLKLQEVATVFSRHNYTRKVSSIFTELGIYLDLLDIKSIEIENLEGFEYLSRIIEDISTYLFEYFVSRVFVDIYLFEDSLADSIQFMKDRLKSADTSNDTSELSFFDD